MELDIVDRQLLNAQSSLQEMRTQERRAFDPNGRLDLHHTGFLTACATLRGQFHERNDRARDTAIKNWQKAWENQLPADEKELYDFMQDDRNTTLHEGRSVRNEKTKELKIGNFYQDDSCIMTSNAGPPGTVGATIQKPHYTYTIAGRERDVTDVCTAYLALLQKLVGEFKAANL